MFEQHHTSDHRWHELMHRMMPYIERARVVYHDLARMDVHELGHVIDRILHDSGVLHHMPHGHTEADMRHVVHAALLAPMSMEMDGAVEAMSPLVPLAFGFGWPYYPFLPFFPFFPHHPRHFRPGRPGGRPGGGRPGGGRPGGGRR